MTYQQERDEFIGKAAKEGLDTGTIRKLLSYSTTLQRYAVAECNGDWPADNGERKVIQCPRCEAGYVESSFRRSNAWGDAEKSIMICPNCKTEEKVRALLPAGFEAHFAGDPRGAVLRLSTPHYPYDERGRNGSYGLYVPARSK